MIEKISKVPEKVLNLKNEIYKDTYNQSDWVYVKLQSLLEYICQMYDYTKSLDDEKGQYSVSAIDRMRYLFREYIKDPLIPECLEKINRYANVVKHSVDDIKIEKAEFDNTFVNHCYKQYNKFVLILFNKDGKLYVLDNKIADQNGKSNISVKAKDKNNLSFVQNKTSINDKKNRNEEVNIPCGVSKQDFGFKIKNLVTENKCIHENASIYATIFSFMQRCTQVKKGRYIQDFEREHRVTTNYAYIYRFEIIILTMIKNNYFENNCLRINSSENLNKELLIAVKEINYYFSMISELMDILFNPITIDIDDNGYSISIEGDIEADIYSVNNENRETNDRNIWFEESNHYNVRNTSRCEEILHILLIEFFGYNSFLPGQKDVLMRLLNGNDNLLCILPTGGGKSLLYFFVALLQPSITLIISPTEILIQDQIRNLIETHQIDDVIEVDEIFDGKYDQTILKNKLIYVTPGVLQQREVILKMITFNVELKISGIVLDEVHTISNWSHDFRPDYLMLSFNLQNFIDNARYICFTATANFRVLNDIAGQLKIPFENVVSPVEMNKKNLSFQFIQVLEEDEFAKSFCIAAKELSCSGYDNQKMLTFIKHEHITSKLINSLDTNTRYNIDIFSSNDMLSYEGFIKCRKSILIADSSMGIGINIPDVQKVFHIGIPVSKGQYVQEIGRAGRNGESAVSVVVYKNKNNLTSPEKTIIDFNTSVDEILSILTTMPIDNDLAISMRKILGHLDHYSYTAKKINMLYEYLHDINCVARVTFTKDDDIQFDRQQVFMYFLFRMGIIYNWYVVEMDSKRVICDIEVEENKNDLSHVKKASINYISSLAQDKKNIFEIESSTSIKEIIYLVQEWYYNQFLRYHREQILNILDFFHVNTNNCTSKEEIAEQLSDYFSVSAIALRRDEQTYISSISLFEMIEIMQNNPDPILNSRIESALENKYDSKLDLYVFLNQLYSNNYLNISRFIRVITTINQNTWLDLLDNVYYLFRKCKDDNEKLEILNALIVRENEDNLMENIYSRNPKDTIYYAYLARKINVEFKKMEE